MTRAAVASQLLKVGAVAELLAVSDRTVWRLIATGQLPSLKVGAQRRVAAADVEAFVQRARCRTLGMLA